MDLHQRLGIALHWGDMLDSRPTLELFLFYQLEEMSVLLGWGLLLGIPSIVKRNKHESQKNWDCERLA